MDDATNLVGGYTIVAGERFGKPEPAERVYGTTVRFTGDTVTVTDKRDQELYAATYQLDTTHTPWRIAMTATRAPNSGDRAVGLVEKHGDTVRLIYSLPGAEPPTGFQTKDGQLMFEMKNLVK
jgi:uncharacterized protein (TIGR03067 family)